MMRGTSRQARLAFATLLMLAGCSGGTQPGASATGGSRSPVPPSGGTTATAGGGSGQGGLGTSVNAAGGGGTAGAGGSTDASIPPQGGGPGGRSSDGGGATGGASGGKTGSSTSLGGSGGQAEGMGGAVGVGGGSTGSGGQAGSTASDAGPDVQPGRDATQDVAADRPMGDATSIPGTNNPVLAGLFADPNIVVFDSTFYIYPTTDGVANWGATSFSAFSSKNLVQWTNQGVILNVATDLSWAKGRAWAPTIARVGDTYYFYFSAETQIGVATSQSPTGPFKDALGHPLVTTAQYAPQSIDPYVFLDDDGSRYLYFGSGSGGLRVAKLNTDMISFANTPTNISPGGASGTLEGSAMFKRNGTYYLHWSEGDTRNASYSMAYAKASSALGPFTRLAVILQQDANLGILGPGGGTILAIPARDEYYIAYHRFKIPGGDGTHRETCIDRLLFNNDGTIAPVKPTLGGLQTAVLP